MIKKALPIIWEIEFKKIIVKYAIDENVQAFAIYKMSFILININLLQKDLIVLFFFKKILILDKFFNYNNVFSKKFAGVLSRHTKINKHVI